MLVFQHNLVEGVNMTTNNNTVAFTDSKKHYEILDGLRGVAALMVVIFHIFEAHATNHFDQFINHGYLAVDFFFVLSGFVIGYAYDDRWNSMTTTDFFKRRLIRLHPMIIAGMLIGACLFYFQSSKMFNLIEATPLQQMLFITVIGMTLIPVIPAMDIRGWQEMHPVNGPAWSLFFEYVANILYALFIRRFSNTLLAVLVFLAGCATIHLTVFSGKGDVIGGWSLTGEQLHIGFVRLMFPFFAGLLLSRMVKPGRINNAFAWCSLLLIICLSMPRFGTDETPWINGIYESIIILLVLPFIVYVGASGSLNEGFLQKVCGFLGAISYPIYITHYPFVYTYTAWVQNNTPSFSQALPYALVSIILCVITAYACLKLYDIPVRKWLAKRFI